jgi:hypothetical protein
MVMDSLVDMLEEFTLLLMEVMVVMDTEETSAMVGSGDTEAMVALDLAVVVKETSV